MSTSSPGRLALAATALTVLAIWLVGLLVPAQVPLDPPRWLPLPSDAGSWHRIGDPGAATFGSGVSLSSSVVGTNALYLDLPLARPAPDTRLQLSGRVVEERREGRSWTTGSIGASFKASSGRRLGYVELRSVPRRATNGERFSVVLDWPAEAASVELVLRSRAGAPAFSLLEGSAELVRPDPLYRLSLGALAALALVWLWSIVRFARSRDALAALLAPGALAAAIVVGVTLSMRSLRPMMLPLLARLEESHGIEREIATVVLLKGGHALGFFLLTLGLLRLRRPLRVGATPLVAFAVLLAVGSEGLQSHLANRGASLLDVLVDVAGVLAALSLVALLGAGRPGRSRRRRSGRRRRSRSEGDTDELRPVSPVSASPAPADRPRATARGETGRRDTARPPPAEGPRRRRVRRGSRSRAG